ncbi:hypothetical protein BP5796_03103 [Coleophoma crateriformis]|uniref:Uncharacterized protein n=1 Tax=Coleophoma crateriformis TaxID=565419 RepID=A0A3D8SM37_9HELO|nr:hypothetical protein BP5796_03103 [Coleophoma crateriformis]
MASTSSAVISSSRDFPPITIGDQVFRSKADIITYLESMPPHEQYREQTIIRDKLLQEYANLSKAYENAKLSRQQFLKENETLVQEVRNIKAKRDMRTESLKRLKKHLTLERGQALLATIERDPTISGKTFLTDLATVFSQVIARIGVAYLNTAILARNRRLRTTGMRPRAGLMGIDAKEAKQWIKAGEDWEEEELSIKELRALRLRYDESGLLEEGYATSDDPPEFGDEKVIQSTEDTVPGTRAIESEPPSDAASPTTDRNTPPLLTPASTASRKRSLTRALAESTPSKKPRGPAHDRSPCDYAMAADWKQTVEHPAATDGFDQAREKLRAVVHAPDATPPCLWHLQRLCAQLRLKTHGLTATTLSARLHEVWDASIGDDGYIRMISSNRTYLYFLEAADLKDIHDQHNLGVLKFAPVAALAPLDKTQFILPAVSPQARAQLATEDYITVEGLYDWLRKDKTLVTIALDEARMYQYHCRPERPADGVVIPQCIAILQASFQANKEERECIDLSSDAAQPLLGEQPWEQVSLRKNGALYTKSSTPIWYSFTTSSEPWLSLSSGLTALAKDDPTLLENRVAVEHITQCHKKMTVPDRPRFAQDRDHIPGSFPPAVELSNLGALSSALVGRMEWDSPAVEEQKRLVLTGDPKESKQGQPSDLAADDKVFNLDRVRVSVSEGEGKGKGNEKVKDSERDSEDDSGEDSEDDSEEEDPAQV